MDNKTMKKYVYELVQITPDVYYTLGLFCTLHDAVKALEQKPNVDSDSGLTKYSIRSHQLNQVGYENYTPLLVGTYDQIMEKWNK